MRSGSVGRCPGRRYDRSHRLVLGQVRRLEVEMDEVEDEPALASPDGESWGQLLYFPGVEPASRT